MASIDDYLEFCHWHVESGDIDPVYPVLEWLQGGLCDSKEDQLAFTFLYVAYYNLPSAVATWLDGWRLGKPFNDEWLTRPTGVERRAHRDVRQFAKHIESLNAFHARYGLQEFLDVTDWANLQERIMAIRGNGRWAAYKTGEILSTVHGHPAKPTDAGHANSTGPRKGLADVYPLTAGLAGNSPRVIRLLDAHTNDLVRSTGLPVEQVETTLCDWHSTLKGAYYVGHDIDQQQEQYVRNDHRYVAELIRTARHEVFAPRWLGEQQGWSGVRKPLNRLYVDTGKIRWWE